MNKAMMFMLCGICSFVFCFSQDNKDLFTIHFAQDFEDDDTGVYVYSQFLEDFNYPKVNAPIKLGGVDYWNEFPRIFIHEENGNKFMRHLSDSGSLGCRNPNGMEWYAPLDRNHEEVYFSFKVRFKPGFEPVLSGKIGGGTFALPRHLTGTPPAYDEGYTQTLTWAQGSDKSWKDLVQYIYHHDQRGIYGDSYRLNYGIPDGRWITITTRLVLNTVTDNKGNYDGICETFVDGVFCLQLTNLRLRNYEFVKIDNLTISNFFGGGSDEFRAIRDEYCDFDDFIVWEYADNVDCVRGNNPSPKDRILILPNSSGLTVVPTPEPEPESQPDSTKINIEAYGDALHGVNAHFNLLVNNEKINETYVTSTEDIYSFDLTYPIKTNDTIYIVFTNDEYIEGEGDRNLHITSVTVNGQKHYPGDSNVIYVKEGAKGVEIVNGTSRISYNGQLVFFLGETNVDHELIYPLFEEPPVFTNSPPEITNQTLSCVDTLKDGTVVGKMIASDPDPDQNINFRISSGNTSNAFLINSSSGDISIANSTYLQNNDQFLLEVVVEDDFQPKESDTALIVININHIMKRVPKTTVFYIDPSNINDLHEDGSIAHPFDSWADVNWKSGNTYLQKRGTIAYESKINLTASNITIEAYGEGELPMIRSQAKDFAMRAYERKSITINDIHFIADEAISCIYFLGSTCDSISISNCIFESSSNGIRIIEGKTFNIYYNTFIGCVDGIYSFAENNKIYYNVFKDNIEAINVSSYLSKADIYNNVFYYNKTGISASYSELVIYNNIFYLEEKGNQALNYNFDKLVSDNNIYYPEQDGFLNINNVNYASLEKYQTETGLDMNSFTQDPQFIDVYNNNFGLKSTSPAIDAGINVGANLDFYGSTVPYGNAPDIGLKETQQSRAITGIKDNVMDMTASDGPIVYPNPTDGIIHISYDVSSTSDMQIIIKDISGRTVLFDRIPGGFSTYQSELDLSGQPAGIYLAIFSAFGKSFQQKIIKN